MNNLDLQKWQFVTAKAGGGGNKQITMIVPTTKT
jgi:hypothetical protein